MFRVEGIIAWMFHVVLNGSKMETLQQTKRVCFSGLMGQQTQKMVGDVVAMSNLSEEEALPRQGMSESAVKDEMVQAFQAFQVGANLAGHLREAAAASATDNDDANAMESSESSGSENLPQQLRMEIHH